MKKRLLFRLLGLFVIITILVQAPIPIPQTPKVHAAVTNEIDINYKKIVIDINQSIALQMNGIQSKVTWKTSSASIAPVNTNGVVTGKRIGTATITATVAKKKYTCQVSVRNSFSAIPYEHFKHCDADYMSSNYLILLDMGSTFNDFNSVGYNTTGVYASVHSSKTVYIEGLDKNGKSLGIVKNNDLSYIQFDDAVKLRIMNPDSVLYTMDFFPAKPTIINQKGYYTYSDFTWYKLKDGNIQAPVIFAMKNSYMEYVADTEETKKSAYNAVGYLASTPHNTGKVLDPEMMNAWKNGYFTSKTIEKAGDLTNLKIYVDQYKVYYDEKDFYVYGKDGLNFPDNYVETVLAYRDTVKKIASEKYLPDKNVWSKPLRLRYTYELISSATKDFMCMNIDDIPSTYYHEMTHYYHLESMDYGSQINAWTEGIAEAMNEDAQISLGEDTTSMSNFMNSLPAISEENLKNFDKYYLNVGYQNNDCYKVGYNFIRYIQKQYGDDIVYKINEKLLKTKDSQKYYCISPSNRTEKDDEVFIQAIKDATSENVFTQFVNDVVKLKMYR